MGKLPLTIILLSIASLANGATYTAATANYADVNACMTNRAQCSPAGPTGAMVDGDTLKIPPGTVNWGNTLNITKAITITGAGLSTFISQTASVVTLNLANVMPGKSYEISNMKIGGNGTKIDCHGSNYIDTSHGVKIDQIWFTGSGFSIYFHDAVIVALVKHCYFPQALVGTETTYCWMDHVGEVEFPGANFGDGSWALGHYEASWMATYFEDCVLGHNFDGVRGARYVVRHCTYDPPGQGVASHGGIDSSGRGRGTLYLDVYNNIWAKATSPGMVTTRGGNGRIFNNHGTGAYQRPMQIYYYCISEPRESFGGADGRTKYDRNATGTIQTPPGSGHNHTAVSSPGNGEGDVYADFTYTGTSIQFPKDAGVHDVTLPLTGHQTDCWKYFTVTNLDQPHPAIGAKQTTVWYMFCVGNDASSGGNTVFHLQFVGSATVQTIGMRFNNGDHIRIYKVDSILDGVGRGQGPYLSGGDGPVFPNGELFNDEASWGLFFWNNKTRPNSGASYTIASISPTNGGGPYTGPANSLAPVRENREFFNRAPTSSDPGGDYNWNPTASGTSANWVGADSWLADNFGITYPAHDTEVGTGGMPYPHEFEVTTPAITSTSSATFTEGTTPVCTGTLANCFKVTTANFSVSNPSLSIGTWSPSTPANVTFTDNGDGTGKFSGTATGAGSATPYTVTVTAHHAGDTDATQSFSLTVNSTNAAPTASVSVSAPANGTSYTTEEKITIKGTAGDTDGSVPQIDLFDSFGSTPTTAIKTCTGTNITTCSLTTTLASGTHGFTAKATDNDGATFTSDAKTIVVSPTSLPPPAPGNVIITP
jgi:hypothetical protein